MMEIEFDDDDDDGWMESFGRDFLCGLVRSLFVIILLAFSLRQ